MFKEKESLSLVLREHSGRRQLHLKVKYKSSRPVVLELSCALESRAVWKIFMLVSHILKFGCNMIITIFLNFLGDFNMLLRLSFKFTLSFLICKIKKKNPCSLPSLPHKHIEGKGENNGKVLVWWIKCATERQSSIGCISTKTMIRKEKCVIEFILLTLETGSILFGS